MSGPGAAKTAEKHSDTAQIRRGAEVVPAPLASQPFAPILALQRAAGNRAVEGLLHTDAAVAQPLAPHGPLPRSPGIEQGSALQTKLIVNQSGDAYEQEADRVADQVMRMPAPAPLVVDQHASATDGLHFARDLDRPNVQRCGAMPCDCSPEEQAAHAGEQKEGLQRASSPSSRASKHAVGGRAAPPIVHQVVGSHGRPLDTDSRAFMEARFGHDFGAVRIHDDATAAESARAVGALAYTVGHDVVFGTGRYVPGTTAGRQLLAHELAHVAQQAGSTVLGAPYVSNSHHDQYEHSAGYAPKNVGMEAPVGLLSSSQFTLRRKDPIEVELEPVSSEENEQLEKQGIHLPSVSETTWRSIGGVGHHAGKALSADEKARIETILKTAGMPQGAQVASVSGPKFLLHDTSAPVGAASIESERAIGRGPLGKGVSAYVPRAGAATIARPDFYETRRPSTTSFEKAADVIKEAPRERAFREVWTATKPAERASALDRALAGEGLTPKEIAAEKKAAIDQLNSSSGKIFTTAAWAIGEICDQVAKRGAEAVADSSKADPTKPDPVKVTALKTSCATLAPYFSTRNARVGATVPVEIVQVGVKPRAKSENTCDPSNPDIEPMPTPPYSDDQYSSLVNLYLRAALMAGSFPEITTHFVVDAFERGHCDPRCFDLIKLYKMIAIALGHGVGSTYGVAPSFGTSWGANSIWWDNRICGGPHP